MQITDADREAALALRVILADISGFWHKPGDDSPICQALARHREEAEARLAGKVIPITAATVSPRDNLDFGRTPWTATVSRRLPMPPSVASLGDTHAD